jgi:hypothetical protein
VVGSISYCGRTLDSEADMGLSNKTWMILATFAGIISAAVAVVQFFQPAELRRDASYVLQINETGNTAHPNSNNTTLAQNQVSQNQNCNVSGSPNAVVNCVQSGNTGGPTPAFAPTGEHGCWRGGAFIPTCPFGTGYSIEHRQCVPAQYIGGVIPCSADDRSCGPCQ